MGNLHLILLLNAATEIELKLLLLLSEYAEHYASYADKMLTQIYTYRNKRRQRRLFYAAIPAL